MPNEVETVSGDGESLKKISANSQDEAYAALAHTVAISQEKKKDNDGKDLGSKTQPEQPPSEAKPEKTSANPNAPTEVRDNTTGGAAPQDGSTGFLNDKVVREFVGAIYKNVAQKHNKDNKEDQKSINDKLKTTGESLTKEEVIDLSPDSVLSTIIKNNLKLDDQIKNNDDGVTTVETFLNNFGFTDLVTLLGKPDTIQKADISEIVAGAYETSSIGGFSEKNTKDQEAYTYNIPQTIGGKEQIAEVTYFKNDASELVQSVKAGEVSGIVKESDGFIKTDAKKANTIDFVLKKDGEIKVTDSGTGQVEIDISKNNSGKGISKAGIGGVQYDKEGEPILRIDSGFTGTFELKIDENGQSIKFEDGAFKYKASASAGEIELSAKDDNVREFSLKDAVKILQQKQRKSTSQSAGWNVDDTSSLSEQISVPDNKEHTPRSTSTNRLNSSSDSNSVSEGSISGSLSNEQSTDILSQQQSDQQSITPEDKSQQGQQSATKQEDGQETPKISAQDQSDSKKKGVPSKQQKTGIFRKIFGSNKSKAASAEQEDQSSSVEDVSNTTQNSPTQEEIKQEFEEKFKEYRRSSKGNLEKATNEQIKELYDLSKQIEMKAIADDIASDGSSRARAARNKISNENKRISDKIKLVTKQVEKKPRLKSSIGAEGVGVSGLDSAGADFLSVESASSFTTPEIENTNSIPTILQQEALNIGRGARTDSQNPDAVREPNQEENSAGKSTDGEGKKKGGWKRSILRGRGRQIEGQEFKLPPEEGRKLT